MLKGCTPHQGHQALSRDRTKLPRKGTRLHRVCVELPTGGTGLPTEGTELIGSQNISGWKGPIRIIESNSLLPASCRTT